MSQAYARPLISNPLLEHFLKTVLEYDCDDLDEVVAKVMNCEMQLLGFDYDKSTINSKDLRDSKFRSESERAKLRVQIVNELFDQLRLPKDDDIILGKGGAVPYSNLKLDRKAFIVIGLPASGKSYVSNKISDEYGAYILDADYAKRKLPEYKRMLSGATIVHDESSDIIFSKNNKGFKSLLMKCIDIGVNLVIPRIGHGKQSIRDFSEFLFKELGYEVHLILVNATKKKATARALDRFLSSNRYVPLALIFDGYSNEPHLTYYQLRSENCEVISEFSEISTDSRPAICVNSTNDDFLTFFNHSQDEQ